jgi:Ca-activated chloride channel family protein
LLQKDSTTVSDGDVPRQAFAGKAYDKEGGTGTRTKGEEGAMGAPAAHYAVRGPADNQPTELPAREPQAAAAAVAPAEPSKPMPPAAQPGSAPEKTAEKERGDAMQFGTIGILGQDAVDAKVASALAPTAAASAVVMAAPPQASVAFGAAGLGLSGVGEGGGGRATRKAPASRNQLDNLEPKTRGALAVDRVAGNAQGLKQREHSTLTGSVAVNVSVRVGDLPRILLGCSGAADVPLADRVALWRERLQKASGDPSQVAAVYRRALADCEAPTWRERSRLLGLLLDALPSVPSQIQLWHIMFADLGASDALYRGILARVHTPAQMRELHAALGLKAVDPTLLARVIQNAKSPAERVTTLRSMAAEWPDDFSVALALLDALEDAGDVAGARGEARRLRARPDADAHLRTAVGELYLRLAAAAKGNPEKTELSAEARRAFGEIVEFAPEDPVARRRLGELLCAHGWFADARRQFETLQTLAPDDPSVSLLLASAAEGQGLLDEALKWAEKASGVSAPDSVSTIAARALEATYLAWGRQAARTAARAKELEALTTRATRVLASVHSDTDSAPGVRITLTWLHPEFHPTLWSNALGAPMPAAEGDPMLGVAQVKVPDRADAFVEVRLEPSDVERMARLGAEAHLTAVFDELGAHEKIVDVPLHFARGGPSTQRFSLANGEVKND